MSQRRKQRQREAMQYAQVHNQEVVKLDTWLSDCRAQIPSCHAGGAGRDTGEGVPSEVRAEGGTGELSGVARARRGGIVTGAGSIEVGLLVVREAEPGIPPGPFFSGLGVRGGPAALSTVSDAGW